VVNQSDFSSDSPSIVSPILRGSVKTLGKQAAPAAAAGPAGSAVGGTGKRLWGSVTDLPGSSRKFQRRRAGSRGTQVTKASSFKKREKKRRMRFTAYGHCSCL
jgi:hypothetical protein